MIISRESLLFCDAGSCTLSTRRWLFEKKGCLATCSSKTQHLERLRLRLLLICSIVIGFGGYALASDIPIAESSVRGSQVSTDPKFWDYWGDGLAEVNTYDAVVERYGELRHGKTTLIFVTETVSNKTWIKDDSGNLSSGDRIAVMKLNAVTDFKTGAYDYHVMTSTFAPVDPYQGLPAFFPRKIAITVSEWCGHVFQQVFPMKNAAKFRSFSYFGDEGEVERTRRYDNGGLSVMYFDALPILFRRLKGNPESVFPNSDQIMKVRVVPSLWWGRKAHVDPIPKEAMIKMIDHSKGLKEYEYHLAFSDKSLPQSTWTFESTYPHRLKKIATSDGELLTLISSKRMPYWDMKSNNNAK